MARPSPVPPYLRVVDESACENDWNSRPMPSSEMPMPVSRIGERELHLLRRDGPRGDAHDDLAPLGELHRVGQEVEQDLPQARHVAADRRRHVAFEDVRGVQVLLDARAR